MTKRIFHSLFFTALAALLAALGLIVGALHSYFTEVQLRQLRVETALASHAVANEGLNYFTKLDDTMDCRITWIAADGTVLYDNRSDSVGMENHLAREEVQEALRHTYGRSIRHSDTLMERYIYAAERLPDGTILRLSTSQRSVLNLLLDLSGSLILIILITVVLALYLSGRLAAHLVKPLNELDLDNPMTNSGYEEIQPLLRRLDSQQTQLKAQETELKRRQKEFNTVTQSLSEGLVLLSSGGSILSINPAAARLLDVTQNCLGADFSVANRNPEIADLVELALTGQKSEQTVSLSSGQFLAAASPVRSGGSVSGVVLLLFNVTQKHQAELLRREFTANVSHELKTPLHTISGYAELIQSGLGSQEDTPAFGAKIYAESQRLIHLVENILRLSHLDEGAEDLQWGMVSIAALAESIAEDLSTPAELAEVQISLTADSGTVYAIPQLVSGILFNLTDNAIKYNRPGGQVRLQVETGDTHVVLTVSDTGIGIPDEQQARIFERFYRVDKSHSKAAGGTGLGLSIVKHAVQILGAELLLTSAPGTGTTVRIRFPRQEPPLSP